MFHACIHISILGVCDVEVEEKLAQVNSTTVADLEVYLFNPSSILFKFFPPSDTPLHYRGNVEGYMCGDISERFRGI